MHHQYFSRVNNSEVKPETVVLYHSTHFAHFAHAQQPVVDTMWGMALARSINWSIPVNFFLDFRLLSAFDSFWQAINKQNGDLCC